MKKLLLTLPLVLAFNSASYAAQWYVTADGHDANDGTSITTAFRTLAKAESVVQAGDVVLIGEGIYSDSGYGGVLAASKSGRADAYIVWKAMPGQKPVIIANQWNGIVVYGSYQIFEGLTVAGNNQRIALADALQDAKRNNPDGYYNANGISIDGRNLPPQSKPHHIIVRKCVIHDVSGGGLGAMQADHVTFEDNQVYNNAWFMRYGGSGISILEPWASDNEPGYHNVIQRNYVWNNKTMVEWEVVGRLSDGNGIIIDVTDGDEVGATNPNGDVIVNPPPPSTDKSKRPEWTNRTLVTNNLSAFNGGSGIHTFRAAHVDIINNTTYSNGSNVGYPELFAAWSHDVTIMNNIMVPRPGGRVTSNDKNRDIRWDYNLYPVDQGILKGDHDIVADPQFIKIEQDTLHGDYRLAASSPARDSATNQLAPLNDITGRRRVVANGIDRGAYEQQGSKPNDGPGDSSK